ncbi:MAG: alpha/beta hydrolase [Tannerellaceae bacterium]|nr:alpha/beta hydrolase [Tannerellaceae bacterium]
MNKISNLFTAIIAVILAACSGSPTIDPPVIEPEESPYFVSVTDSATGTGADFLVKTIGNEYLALLFTMTAGNKLADVRVDAIRYYTADPAGKKIIASGIVARPASEDIRGVILAGHGTIGASREAPSEMMTDWMSLLALAGYMVVSPDYIGYGASKDLPHPYLHAGLTASACIDMYFAVRDYMAMLGEPLPSKELHVMGYSQGGSAALAVQKLAETEYTDEISIRSVMAGGGPYDLTLIFDQVKEKQIEPSPFIPMVILGLDYGDSLQLDYSQFFLAPLLNSYREWIFGKELTIGEIHERIGNDFLSPALFAGEANADVAKLYASLEANSLVGWKPNAPLTLIHGRTDATVPPACAEKAYQSFTELGAKVELKMAASGHTDTILFFILEVLKQFT